jgi:hypothetical protein
MGTRGLLGMNVRIALRDEHVERKTDELGGEGMQPIEASVGIPSSTTTFLPST